jgi:hypothetical protein
MALSILQEMTPVVDKTIGKLRVKKFKFDPLICHSQNGEELAEFCEWLCAQSSLQQLLGNSAVCYPQPHSRVYLGECRNK